MKKFFSLFVLALFAVSARGELISPAQALERLSTVGAATRSAELASSFNLAHTLQTDSGEAAIYIYDNTDNAGYLILSADDTAPALLGYADNGSFDAANMPPQMEWWLAEYSQQIQVARRLGVKAAATRGDAAKRSVVAPLIKTRWNQDAPYNLLVPSYSNRNYPTGCVATAMAQVMKYWNYPAKGTGRGYITLPSGATGDSDMNLRINFDWANMLDVYKSGQYNDTQATAVATLMKACGYASKMQYASGGSGTLSRFAATALISNFTYNSNIRYCEREYYSLADWDALIYAEVAAGRPVLYGGQSSSGGHEFVCDGYDGSGYYHFNWGWGGMSDGYFLLGALDPNSVGIGGGTGNDGFNNSQDIIIGIQPETGTAYTPRLTQFGNLIASLAGSNVTLRLDYGSQQGYWVNSDIRDISVDLGAVFQSYGTAQKTETSVVITSGKVTAPTLTESDGSYRVQYQGYNGQLSFALPASLADGTYRVTISTRPLSGTDAQWEPVLAEDGNNNYFYIKKQGTAWSLLQTVPTPVTITACTVQGRAYYGCEMKYDLTVSNPAAATRTAHIIPQLFATDNTLAMTGDEFEISAAPGASQISGLTTIFRLVAEQKAPTRATSYILKFKDAETDVYYDFSLQVRMQTNGADAFAITEFVLTNGTLTDEKTDGADEPNVYSVGDKSNIAFSTTVENKGVYFGYGISALVTAQDAPETVLATTQFAPTLTLSTANESGTTFGVLDFSGAESTQLYAAKLYLMTPNGMSEIKNSPTVWFRVSSSAVRELDAETLGAIYFNKADREVIAEGSFAKFTLYNLDGMKLAEVASQTPGNLSLSLKDTPAGILIAVAVSPSGTPRTMKIIN